MRTVRTIYETRQSGGKKISPATIAEAQLIGRGARYCPFQLDDEQPKFQRKYDNDVGNEMRVCETLYYHCQNDHRYITELRTALREIGLDKSKVIQREYVLKDEFKDTELYKEGMIFLNDITQAFDAPSANLELCDLISPPLQSAVILAHASA